MQHFALVTKDFVNSGYLSLARGWVPSKYRAYCETSGCGWAGENRDSMTEAQTDADVHTAWVSRVAS